MSGTYKNPYPIRMTLPIPGVPDSQARALDRRLRLHRQLQSFQGPRLYVPTGSQEQSTGDGFIDPAAPVPA